MAYIIGAASDEEIKELERRGWVTEILPENQMAIPVSREVPDKAGDQVVVIYVDNDLFKIMSGPDWEK